MKRKQDTYSNLILIMRRKGILAPLFLTLLTTSCSSIPKRQVLLSNLDGAWILSDLQCSTGTLNKLGALQRESIKNGFLKTITIVTGDEVHSFYFTLPTNLKEHPTSRCDTKLSERWIVDSNKHTITISDSEVKNTAININPDINFCKKDSFNNNHSRTHNYSLKDALLYVTVSETTSLSGEKMETSCTSGQDVFVYKRVL